MEYRSIFVTSLSFVVVYINLQFFLIAKVIEDTHYVFSTGRINPPSNKFSNFIYTTSA